MSNEIIRVNNIDQLCRITAGWSKLNLGGLIEIIAFDEGAILSAPTYRYAFDENRKMQLDGKITLRQGAEFYYFKFTPDTGGFTEEEVDTENGVHYDQSLSAFFPKDHPEYTYVKHTMRNRRYAFLYRDSNGLVKLLRNHRTQSNLNTQTQQSQKNGHNFRTRQLSLAPAMLLIDPVSKDSVLTNIDLAFEDTTPIYKVQRQIYAGGFTKGTTIQLNHPAIWTKSVQVWLNGTLTLKQGRDYNNSLDQITLCFDEAGESSIDVIYPTLNLGTAISAFNKHTATKTASYVSGEQFTLPSSPISSDHLKIIHNDTILLRHGIDYTLAGADVTILFDSDPTPTDTDTFTCFYTTGGGANLTLKGYDTFVIRTTLDIAVNTTYTLRHTPIANSVEVYLNDAVLLLEGTDYQVTNDEIEFLIQIDADANEDINEVRVFHAY